MYVRDTAGRPAVRLGEGRALALSPDAEWALTAEVTAGVPNDHLTLVPIGPGQAKLLERSGITYHEARGRWLPDGERVFVYARKGDGRFRFYVQEIDGEGFDSVTPEDLGVLDWELSPDGTLLAVSTDRRVELYPVDGGEPRRVPGPTVEGALLAWIDEGLLVLRPGGTSSNPIDNVIPIDLLDPVSSRRKRWREIQPRDPAGIMVTLSGFQATPDGRSYGYSWHRALSDLYLIEGLS